MGGTSLPYRMATPHPDSLTERLDDGCLRILAGGWNPGRNRPKKMCWNYEMPAR